MAKSVCTRKQHGYILAVKKKQYRRKIMLNIVHNIMNLSDPVLKTLIQDVVLDVHACRMYSFLVSPCSRTRMG